MKLNKKLAILNTSILTISSKKSPTSISGG